MENTIFDILRRVMWVKRNQQMLKAYIKRYSKKKRMKSANPWHMVGKIAMWTISIVFVCKDIQIMCGNYMVLSGRKQLLLS